MLVHQSPKIAALLCAAAIAACAQRPPAPAAEPLRVPHSQPALSVSRIVLHGPADNTDLETALADFHGRDYDTALAQATLAYVRDYYTWLEWHNVRALADSALAADGTLSIIVTAEPPQSTPEPPLALVEESPVPPPREPGGARVETALDDSFRPWLQSADRVLIDATEKRLYLRHDNGRVVSYAVAVGTARTPTPPGQYSVLGMRHKPAWYPPASIRREYEAKGKPLPPVVPPGSGNPLGDWFVQMQNSIGIHGTNQPRSIGRAASHGCIRMHDRDVAELVKTLRKGDGVTIMRTRLARTATR